MSLKAEIKIFVLLIKIWISKTVVFYIHISFKCTGHPSAFLLKHIHKYTLEINLYESNIGRRGKYRIFGIRDITRRTNLSHYR